MNTVKQLRREGVTRKELWRTHSRQEVQQLNLRQVIVVSHPARRNQSLSSLQLISCLCTAGICKLQFVKDYKVFLYYYYFLINHNNIIFVCFCFYFPCLTKIINVMTVSVAMNYRQLLARQ